MMTDAEAAAAAAGKNACTPGDLLQAIIKALEGSGADYVLIHDSHEDPAHAVISDVDIAFDRNPLTVMLPILDRMRESVQLVQCLHYEIPHGYYLILRTRGTGEFLHLDCLYDPHGVNRYFLPTKFLLENAERGSWGRRANSDKRAIYLILKRAIKDDLDRERMVASLRSIRKAGVCFWSDVPQWFGRDGASLLRALLTVRDPSHARPLLAKLRAGAVSRARARRPLTTCRGIAADLARKVGRFLRPTGLFVVLVGPDGSGKSTVAAMVQARVARAFRQTWHFHWRPNLLPKLQPNRATAIAGAENASRYRGVIAFCRFIYYWLDFVIGYWLVIYPRRARTTLVIGERYFPDVCVNPARYGFTAPQWLLRLAARAVPSPDLLLLLDDRPERIHGRKPELSVPAISRQLAAYEREIKRWRRFATIDARAGAEAAVEQVGVSILEECARRTARRLRSSSPWLAFPRRTAAKVWIDPAETPRNALRLYHPYSPAGRLAKSFFCTLPAALQRAALQREYTPEVCRQLDALKSIIGDTLGERDLRVSFSTGTPGGHNKLTAQVSGAEIVSYVKIGGESVAPLLEREAQMLAWLKLRNFSAASIPRVLALKRQGSRNLLFLTAPERSGMVPPLQPDSRDLRFLTQLAALGGRQVGAAEVFENLGFSRILPLLEIGNPSAASVLRYAAEAVETIIGAGAIRLAASHGDYTPWNTLRLDDGSLFVFDWEYGDEAAPVLNDAFHYLFLPAMLVRRQPVVSVVERLLALHRHPLFGVLTSGVEQRHLPAYLLLYLVQLALRQQACEGRVSELTHRALRAALARCGHSRLRKNVLVAAYACEPNAGSEPGVGWNMCQAISRDNEAWVITRRNNRQRIEAALVTTPNPHLHFVYADLPRWASFWKKGSRGIRAYYYLWQFAAWWQARRLRDVPFDLAHHITFVNSYMFSFLGLLRVPFVWGPLGSNPDWPTQLVPDLAHRFRHGLRQRARRILPVFDPLYWLCTARARLIIGINADVASVPVSLLAKRKFLCHPAIGVEEALLGARRVEAMPSTFNVLSMGRLIPVKGYHLTLRAFAELVKTEAAARLTIVGAGIEKRRLQALVESLGLEGKVCFVPWLPRADALAIMNSADAFLFPSLEGAGMVVLEAMAQGLPVVCLDYGGPGQMVDRECGFAVPVGTLQSTIEQLSLALKTLARDSGLRSRMASAARRRIAACYLWERRHEAISVWYERAIRADGPPLS